jgi:hypothetical protein
MARTELEDRQDQLRLLALIARGLGAESLEDYEPPSVGIAEFLITLPEPVMGTAARERAVMEFLAQTGGGE